MSVGYEIIGLDAGGHQTWASLRQRENALDDDVVLNWGYPAISDTSCYDYPGWIDAKGERCKSYKYGSEILNSIIFDVILHLFGVENDHESVAATCEGGVAIESPDYFQELANMNGISALEACCACGGGTRD